jgi:type IV pilus assembly protein PilQ
VEVSNGQPFLLGGLIKDSTGSSESGVPFFKDLPLLGWLFRTNANERRFDHVMVFITPTRIVPESSPDVTGLWAGTRGVHKFQRVSHA